MAAVETMDDDMDAIPTFSFEHLGPPQVQRLESGPSQPHRGESGPSHAQRGESSPWARRSVVQLYLPAKRSTTRIVLLWLFPEAGALYKRVEQYILTPDTHGWYSELSTRRLVESYTQSFDMVAIAGAIVAQVAVSALMLPDVAQSHWTVTAAYFVSLASGLGAVYYSCTVKLALTRCQSGTSLMHWLTTPLSLSRELQTLHEMASGDAAELGTRTTLAVGRRAPSVTAAMLLTSPPRMLVTSVLCLMAGILLHLSLRYASDFGDLRGGHANLAVLVVVVGFTTVLIAQHEGLDWLKWLSELTVSRRKRRSAVTASHTLGHVVKTVPHEIQQVGPVDSLRVQPDGEEVQHNSLHHGPGVANAVQTADSSRPQGTRRSLSVHTSSISSSPREKHNTQADEQGSVGLQRVFDTGPAPRVDQSTDTFTHQTSWETVVSEPLVQEHEIIETQVQSA